MKTIFKVLSFVLLSSVFASCGDDKPTPVQRKITKEYIFTAPIQGFKGNLVFVEDLTPIRLSDIIGSEAAKNIVRAEIQSAECYMEVRGLKKMSPSPALANFTIKISEKNKEFNFGNCAPILDLATDFESDRKQSISKVLDLIKATLNTYTHSNKSAHLILSYKPTENILPKDSVNLHIVITADYIYNTYQ